MGEPPDEARAALFQVSDLDPRPPRRGGRGTRLALAGLSLATVVALTLAVVAPRWWHPGPAPAIATRTLPPDRTASACLDGAAWSPDSTRVALIITTIACALDEPTRQDVLEIATAAPFAVQRTIPLSVAINQGLARAAFTPPAGALATSVVYRGLFWRDGARLVIPFNVIYFSPGASYSGPSGLLGVDLTTGTITVTARQLPDAAYSGDTIILWDLASATATLVTLVTLVTLASGTAWRWRADDTLAVDSGATNGPPGDPARDARFTLWQPGMLVAPLAGIALWANEFSALAPDGRTLATGLRGQAVVATGATTPTPEELAKANVPPDTPVVAARDACLTAASAAYPGPATIDQPPATERLAWRPDGRVMALLSDTATLLYACDTGRVVTAPRVTPAAGMPALLYANELAWSPDGRWLLVYSNQAPSGAVIDLGALG